MNLAKEIGILLRKELLLELRNKYAISGILLYVFSTIFIIYAASVGNVQLESWNTLFWIIILFASVNAVLKSFIQENSNQQLYYYTLANPTAIILSKVIYNTGLLLVLCVLTWLSFGFIVGDPIKESGQFALVLLLASSGFSITFTFVSAIAGKTTNNATLMAILSFPLTIPILLTLIKLSAGAMRMIQDTSSENDILILVAIDLILLALSFVLFPFLWRD
jgi:heme exporter protein B